MAKREKCPRCGSDHIATRRGDFDWCADCGATAIGEVWGELKRSFLTAMPLDFLKRRWLPIYVSLVIWLSGVAIYLSAIGKPFSGLAILAVLLYVNWGMGRK